MTTTMISTQLKDLALVDFEREHAVTRRVLERLPEDKFAWKPHEKSMGLGQLALHVATVPLWTLVILEKDELDFASPPNIPQEFGSHAELLRMFDQYVAQVSDALQRTDDAALSRTWTLRNGDQVLHSQTKMFVLRVWCLNHMVHHRAQLCIYLRLLDVPVPAVYFNSADEPDWKFD